jgi:hypothetical protein
MVSNAKNYVSTGFVDALKAPDYSIGGVPLSRQDLIDKLGVGNFNAASRVTKALRRHKITTVEQLLRTHPLDLGNIRGFGEACLWVTMHFIDWQGYSVEKWWGWRKEENQVKFSTFRHRALKRRKRRAS